MVKKLTFIHIGAGNHKNDTGGLCIKGKGADCLMKSNFHCGTLYQNMDFTRHIQTFKNNEHSISSLYVSNTAIIKHLSLH